MVHSPNRSCVCPCATQKWQETRDTNKPWYAFETQALIGSCEEC